MLEVDTLVGEKFVVEVVFDFGHAGSDIDVFQKVFRKVSARQAQAGARGAVQDEFFELLFGKQTVVDGVVHFVTDDELVLATSGAFVCDVIRFFRRLFVLFGSDLRGAYVAGVVKAFAAFVKQQLVFEQRHYVTQKHVLTHAPVFYKLHERHVPAVAERAHQQTQPSTGLAFAFAGVHHYDRLFGFKVFKRHTYYRITSVVRPLYFPARA